MCILFLLIALNIFPQFIYAQILPKQNLTLINVRYKPVSKEEYFVLAKKLNAESKTKIPASDFIQLGASIKSLTTSQALSNAGMTLLVNNGSLNQSLYLITLGALKDAENATLASNLGVLLKNISSYPEALKCFLFAEALNKNSPVIKTNLGWTLAYLGDFDNAKKRFNDAMGLIENYDGALEGLATLSYVQNDMKATMAYLFRRLQFGGYSPVTEKLVDEIEKKTKDDDPFQDHILDNQQDSLETEDEHTAAHGELDAIDYPAFAEFIQTDPEYIENNWHKIYQAWSQLKSQLNQVPVMAIPAAKEPYIEDNTKIIPRSYDKEIFYLKHIAALFERRQTWIDDKLLKKSYDDVEGQFKTKFDVIHNEMDKELRECPVGGKYADCKDDVICKHTEANKKFAAYTAGQIYGYWLAMYDKHLQNINWYISGCAPYIRSINDKKLNDYENKLREYNVRSAILGYFYDWYNLTGHVVNIYTFLPIKAECVHEKDPVADHAPAKPGLKKLQTWPENCVVPTGDYTFEVASLHMTCDELKVSFGKGIKLNYQTKFGDKESQDVTKIYISGGYEKSGSKDVKINGHTVGDVSAGGEIKADMFISLQNGKVLNYGVEGNVEVTGSAAVKSGNDKVDKYLPSGTVTANGNFILSAETGMRISPVAVEGNVGGMLEKL